MQPNLEEVIRYYSINFSLIAFGGIILLTVASILIKEKTEALKYLLFASFCTVAITLTAFLAISTIYLNGHSLSKGPVHYHADFEIWDCGKELNLLDPQGLSNKIGTAVLHEHNDKRIHLEGVMLARSDASLGKFFEVIGGKLTANEIVIPTNSGILRRQNGENCNGGKGSWRVFVYNVNPQTNTYSVRKIVNPQSYVISAQGVVPPGDCIIFEFDSVSKDTTDKMCTSYKAASQLGKIHD